MNLYVSHGCSVPGSQKKESGSRELELQMVVRFHMDSGN